MGVWRLTLETDTKNVYAEQLKSVFCLSMANKSSQTSLSKTEYLSFFL